MIIDCFPFFNEVELTELRFELLTDVVDYFVVCEANLTHSGKAKPRHFQNSEAKWEPYMDQIVYVDVDLTPYSSDWAREGAQRDAIMKGLEALNPRLSDIVIMSDADEIPHPALVGRRTIGWYQQQLFTYYVNLLCPYPWIGSLCTTYYQFTQKTPNQWRQDMHRGMLQLPLSVIPGGGWHFSSLGGVERVKEKLRSYAHQEYNTPETHLSIEYALKNGTDLFGRGEQYERVDPPWVVQDLILRYPNLCL